MVEICIINRILNMVAMLLMVHYFVKLYTVSSYTNFELILYFVSISMTTMQFVRDFNGLLSLSPQTYTVFFPLIRNFVIARILYDYYKLKKRK